MDQRTVAHEKERKVEYTQRILDRFLKLEQVIDMVGMGSTWIYQEIKDGRFPNSVPLGSARRWLLSEVQDWMHKQVDEARREA